MFLSNSTPSLHPKLMNILVMMAVLLTPCMKRQTNGLFPTVFTLVKDKEDIADLAVFNELYPKPFFNNKSRNSTTNMGDGSNGSLFLSPQNCIHLLRCTLYCFCVDCLQDEIMMSVACSDNPLFLIISLTGETQLILSLLLGEFLLDPLVILTDAFSLATGKIGLKSFSEVL